MPDAAKNYSITEPEICGLAINIASFAHLLKRVDFDAVVDHLAIVHIMKSKAKPAKHRIKRLLEILNMINTPNLCNHSPSELIFGRQPKILLDLETYPNIKVSGTYQDYYTLLKKRLHYLQNLLHNFKLKQVALINKDREYFQYNNGDLVYLISPLTSQLRTSSRKVATRYVGPLVIYKIVDCHNYLLMTMDVKLLRGVFEHERLKPAVLKTDKGNVTTLSALKKDMNL